MRRRPFAEALLAVFAERERAGVIYGDLVELAAVRGILWFWMAYARTVIALAWRPVVAFAIALVFFDLVDSLFRLSDSLTHDAGHLSFNFGFAMAFGSIAMGPVLSAITTALWFVVPYAAVRYGLGDRMVRLGGAFFVIYAVTLFWGDMTLAEYWIANAIVLLSGLCVKAWRRPTAVLMATIAVGAGVAACFSQAVPWRVMAALSLLAAVFTCIRMREWLLAGAVRLNACPSEFASR